MNYFFITFHFLLNFFNFLDFLIQKSIFLQVVKIYFSETILKTRLYGWSVDEILSIRNSHEFSFSSFGRENKNFIFTLVSFFHVETQNHSYHYKIESFITCRRRKEKMLSFVILDIIGIFYHQHNFLMRCNVHCATKNYANVI